MNECPHCGRTNDFGFVPELRRRIDELEAQLNAIAGLNDYCLSTISIHRESTNIQLVEDIQTKLQTILRGES